MVRSREEWFCMVINYVKFKTLQSWLHCYPDTSLERFELIWPSLLDSMLDQATQLTIEKLCVLVISEDN